MTFEEQVKELEAIIAKLDGGVGIDEGVKLFERGAQLCKECYAQLDGAKGKLTFIREELGKFVEKDI